MGFSSDDPHIKLFSALLLSGRGQFVHGGLGSEMRLAEIARCWCLESAFAGLTLHMDAGMRAKESLALTAVVVTVDCSKIDC